MLTSPSLRVEPAVAERLYASAGASRWGLSLAHFQATLEASLAHACKTTELESSRDIERYLDGLHLEDLALASACAAGLDEAWDHFIREHRPALYRAATAVTRSEDARELADSLYADLFGLEEREGRRQSLFRYFHGRSKLATWLRAVLAQRQIDRMRAARRLEPIPDEDSPRALSQRLGANPEQLRFAKAMREALVFALAALTPRDRLRVSCYYAQDMTLAAIGRMLGEHEATVSRQLTRTRREIRDGIETALRTQHSIDGAAVAECFRSIIDDVGGLDLAELMGPSAQIETGRKNPGLARSKE